MKIGTDMSLKTCKEEGYLMMEYKVRELISEGALNPDVPVRFFAHAPNYVLEERYGGIIPVGISTIITDISYSSNEVWNIYVKHKEEIDKTSGFSHDFPKTPWDVLSIANDVDMYCGL